jgi:hypothetical protein
MVENIANDLGMKILRDLKKRYVSKKLGFENQSDKDLFFRDQITSDIAKTVTTIRFLITVAPAESDGLSGRDLSIMSGDLLTMLSKISVMDPKKIETLFGLTEESTTLTFNELVDTASTV